MSKCKNAGELKSAIVGYGGAFNMGRKHLQEMKRAGMTPTAVVDIDADRLKIAEEDFPGIQTYTSLGEMLRKSDANFITLITPHNLHAKQATQALKAGKHVCCEKPMAITTAECDRMIRAAKDNGAIITTYHNRHWDGCILNAVKQIKNQGVIGDIVRIEAHMGGFSKPRDWWRTSKSISGGILYDWGVHLLEYSLQLIDGNITEVSGFAKSGVWGPKTAWKDDAIEDEGYAVVRFDTGQWLTLCITTIDSNPKRRQLEITGTKGSYLFDGREWELIKPGAGGKKTVTVGPNPADEGYRFYQNVADHLAKGTDLVITGQWARRPIHILDLACKSAQTGRSMKAKYK